MRGKRIVQIIINSCLALIAIYIIIDEAIREIQPITALIFVLIAILLSLTVFSTLLNIEILKQSKSASYEGRLKFNSRWQFIFLFVAIIFLLVALTFPSFTEVSGDQHVGVFLYIDFGTFVYTVRQEGLQFFYAIVLLFVSFAALVNSNVIKPDSLEPSLLDTSLNRRLINSHILLGALTLSFSLIYCIWLTWSLVGGIRYLNSMSEEMYETLIIWDIALDMIRRYLYSVPFVLYGLWVFKDGRKLKQLLFK